VKVINILLSNCHTDDSLKTACVTQEEVKSITDVQRKHCMELQGNCKK